MSATLEAALAALDSRISVTRGTPASDTWIDEAQARLKTRFCPTYVAFLRAHGALRFQAELASWYGDFSFVGHAPDDEVLDLDAASLRLRDIAEEWNRELPPCAPVVVVEGDWPDALVTADAQVCWFHRGTLGNERGTFEEHAIQWIARATEELKKVDRTEALRAGLLAVAAELVPDAYSPSYTGGRLRLTRPRDGVEILLRLGDGRELGGRGVSGVFASWLEPGDRPREEINEHNLRAAFVRAAHTSDGIRYRGVLSTTGLSPERLLLAVAHDAELTFSLPAPSAPLLAEVRAAIAEPPGRRRLFARRWSPEHVRREGDELHLPVAPPGGLASIGRGPAKPPQVRIRIGRCGLVEAYHEQEIDVPVADALVALNRINTNVLGDNNLDLEPCIRGTLDGTTARLTAVTTADAVPTEVFPYQMGELARAITDAAFLTEQDPMEEVYPELEAQLGLPLGPIGRAVWEHMLNRSQTLLRDRFDRARRGPVRLASPWGELTCFADIDAPGISHATHLDRSPVALAVAVEHGTSFDDCPVIGVGGYLSARDASEHHAQLLAPDLHSFLTVFVLGTSGYGFDGDNALVWRDYRSSDVWFGSDPRRELRDRFDIEPATDIGAVQRAAADKLPGSPAKGTACHGR